MNQKIFIGVSWPYANGDIHLGHLAGQYVTCDIFARYHRLKGNKVLMVSGTDSHGAPIQFSAEQEGLTPQELVERNHKKLVSLYNQLGFLYDNYTTTTTENHTKVVQNIFKVLKDHGYLIVKTSKQYWDPKAEKFLPDRYVRGTCPYCGATNARGDECPECGKFLKPEELKNPRSTQSDATPVLKETKHYYLDLPKFSEKLQKWLDTKDYWRKWVVEFSKGWIKEGLEPRPITRDMKWGIPIPEKGWEDKVIYVWFDAVIGYLSAAIEWADQQGQPSLWEEFWKDPKARHYYFIAGGNVPFHTIIWPSQIIGYNDKYNNSSDLTPKLPGETLNKPLNLPYDVVANKMLLQNGRKMSKGDAVGILVKNLLQKYSPDHIRFFCTRYAPENHDREYNWKDFIEANNTELVGNIGNFINRVLTFVERNFDKTIPKGEMEETVSSEIKKAFTQVGKHIENTEFVKASEALLKFGQFANKYFNDQKPWVTVKTDKRVAAQAIFNSLQLVRAFETLLKPFTPFGAEKLSKILNIKDYDPNKELLETKTVSQFTDQWNFHPLKVGHKINQPEILFSKVEYSEDLAKADAEAKKKTEQIRQKRKANVKISDKPKISYKDFAKLDLRVGLVTTAEFVDWSRKLIKLSVNFGEAQTRTIYAGLRKWYKPEDFVGKKFVFVYNMSPKKVGEGFSEGMILAIGEENPKIFPLPDNVEPGEMLN